VRPIARLEDELRTSGSVALLAGVAGLGAALARGVEPARGLVPFVVVAAVLAAVSAFATRWLREGRGAVPAPGGARVEPTWQTVRRTLVGLSLPVAAVAVGTALAAGLGAVLGGVLAGIGAVDLANMGRARRRRKESGQTLFRELGASPFAGGRRALYTRPT
jgi:hypothetical protein